MPGEAVRVRLIRTGDDPGQAVGFLSDGTMVVVESASRRVGQEVTVEVTSAIQTAAGKMLFGRTRRPPDGRGPGRGGRGGSPRPGGGDPEGREPGAHPSPERAPPARED